MPEDVAPKPEVKAPAPVVPGPVAAVVQEVEREFEALRDFSARTGTQLVSFFKGDRISPKVGADLHAKGAPVRPVG